MSPASRRCGNSRERDDSPDSVERHDDEPVDLPGLGELIDELDARRDGVVMTMGKGGVGKTTLAAAIAVALVDRGHAGDAVDDRPRRAL